MRAAESKVILRALEPSDLDLLYTWENDTKNWRVSNTITPFSKYTLQKYIENSHLDIYQTKQLRLMIDLTNSENKIRTVGAIDIFDFDPYHLRAGVGILIAGNIDRNQGIATITLHELMRYSFDVLQLHQLYCNIANDNLSSLRVFKKVGFVECGTKRDWIKTQEGFVDEVLLQIINPEK
jgi:diamine N-acetyltransferase